MTESTTFLDFYQNYSRHGALKKEEKKESKKNPRGILFPSGLDIQICSVTASVDVNSV